MLLPATGAAGILVEPQLHADRGPIELECPPGILPIACLSLSAIDQAVAASVRSGSKPELPTAPSPGEPDRPAPDRPPSDFGFDNVLVNNAAAATEYDTQTEPVVAHAGDGQLVAAFFDTGGWAEPGDGFHFTGWSTSNDGGESFLDRGQLFESSPDDGGQATLAFDAIAGTVFLAVATPGTISVLRSIDGGQSFELPVPAFPFEDEIGRYEPAMAVDPGLGPQPARTYVLAMETDGQFSSVVFTSSSDGGQTFPPSNARWLWGEFALRPTLVVGADGAIYVFWYRVDIPGAIDYRISRDGGDTFSPAHQLVRLETGYWGDLGFEWSSATARPLAATNPVDPDHVVVVYADARADRSDAADIFLVQTSDGGASWSAPVRVNTDSGTLAQFSPTVAFSPDGSRLFFGWYDRRRDPQDWRIEYWGRIAKVVGTELFFAPDFPISNASFPPVYRQDPILAGSMSDREQAGADEEYFYPIWADTRLRSLWHANQHDIRLARVPVDGPGPLLEAARVSFIGGSCETENRGPDPGERVTEELCIANLGPIATDGLEAALLPLNGVQEPGPAQMFGEIPAGGGEACRQFEFTVDPGLACGAHLAPTLSLSDRAGRTGQLAFRTRVGELGTATYGPFESPTPIQIELGLAEPYPSSILVSGVPWPFDRLELSLLSLSHGSPHATCMLLQGASGQAITIICPTGIDAAIEGVDLGIADEAMLRIPYDAPLESGTYRPTAPVGATSGWDPPAPPENLSAQPWGLSTLASAFRHSDPNGAWNLFIINNDAFRTGVLEQGWRITFYSSAGTCRCNGPFFAGDFEVGDTSQWSSEAENPRARHRT